MFIVAIINAIITIALPNRGSTGTDEDGTAFALLITHFDIRNERSHGLTSCGSVVSPTSRGLNGGGTHT